MLRLTRAVARERLGRLLLAVGLHVFPAPPAAARGRHGARRDRRALSRAHAAARRARACSGGSRSGWRSGRRAWSSRCRISRRGTSPRCSVFRARDSRGGRGAGGRVLTPSESASDIAAAAGARRPARRSALVHRTSAASTRTSTCDADHQRARAMLAAALGAQTLRTSCSWARSRDVFHGELDELRALVDQRKPDSTWCTGPVRAGRGAAAPALAVRVALVLPSHAKALGCRRSRRRRAARRSSRRPRARCRSCSPGGGIFVRAGRRRAR